MTSPSYSLKKPQKASKQDQRSLLSNISSFRLFLSLCGFDGVLSIRRNISSRCFSSPSLWGLFMSFYRSMADGEKEWSGLYELIGRIVVTSNTAHWCVFEVMGILLNMSREDTSPIYYSLKADAAQRDLTLEIARDRLIDPSEAELLAQLTTEMNCLGKLSGQRNAFIHSHWTMEHYGENERRFAVEGKPHPKLELSNPTAQAERVIREMNSLIDRLVSFCDALEEAPSVRKLCERMGGRRR